MSSRIVLNGLRSIEECLKTHPERVAKLLVSGRLSPRLQQLKDQAAKLGIRIESNPQGGGEEQVLAVLKDYEYLEFDALLEELRDLQSQGGRSAVLLLDGVTDPQNLGAIIRTAAFMGVIAVVIPKDRAAMITETVYRVASGGLEHVRVSQVTNLVTAMKSLKDVGFWCVGFSEHAKQSLSEIRQDFSPVLVIGNEEKGMRPLVQENCDFLAKFSARGGLKSLNASVAAALAMDWATKA